MDIERLTKAKAFFKNVDNDTLLTMHGDYARDMGRILATGEGDYEYALVNFTAIETILTERLKGE